MTKLTRLFVVFYNYYTKLKYFKTLMVFYKKRQAHSAMNPSMTDEISYDMKSSLCEGK